MAVYELNTLPLILRDGAPYMRDVYLYGERWIRTEKDWRVRRTTPHDIAHICAGGDETAREVVIAAINRTLAQMWGTSGKRYNLRVWRAHGHFVEVLAVWVNKYARSIDDVLGEEHDAEDEFEFYELSPFYLAVAYTRQKDVAQYKRRLFSARANPMVQLERLDHENIMRPVARRADYTLRTTAAELAFFDIYAKKQGYGFNFSLTLHDVTGTIYAQEVTE